MSLVDSSLQVVLVDVLFLGLAGAMAFWFRSWLKEQKTEMDGRIAALESQQQSLARVCEKLASACRTLERQAPPALGDAWTRPRGAEAGARGAAETQEGEARLKAPIPARGAIRSAPVDAPGVPVGPPRAPSSGTSGTSGTPGTSGTSGTSGTPGTSGTSGGGRVETPAARMDRQWEEMSDRSREAYRRARELLDQGMSAAEIARRVGLGVAEVNVLKRMREAGRR